MTKLNGRYFIAGFCVLSFILAQAFQELAYRSSIPASHGLEDDLRAYLLPVDQARALAVGATILLLLVPYAVIALRYIEVAPVASVLGLIFSAAFVACEISYRSVEFFVVGTKWARAFQNASGIERDAIRSKHPAVLAIEGDILLARPYRASAGGILAEVGTARGIGITIGSNFTIIWLDPALSDVVARSMNPLIVQEIGLRAKMYARRLWYSTSA